MEIKFGTDGIRAEVNKGLTPEIAYKVGCALALFLSEKDVKTVLIAKDTRKSCDMLMCALSSGLMAHGVSVHYASFLPTPALAYLTKKFCYSAGVMITASHNAHNYNGIKIFNSEGLKFSTSDCLSLEKISKCAYPLAHCGEVGEFNHVNLSSHYVRFLKRKLRKYNFPICFDCANGVTSDFARRVFCNISNNVKFIFTSKESESVNYKCGATDLTALSKYVLDNGYKVGFAFDGDGDRIIAVDERGEVVDGDELVYIIAKYLLNKGRLRYKTVVGTVMTNYGVQASLTELGIKLVREQVGDKYIQRNLVKNGFVLGGEQSGHIIISNKSVTGDGLLVACEILNILRESGKNLFELKNEIKKFPQKQVNIAVSGEMKDYIIKNDELISLVNRAENELSGFGRVLVRASGTENVIRVLVEGEDNKLINVICREICKTINKLAK